MAVNVKKLASSGAEILHFGVIDSTGYFQGSTATPPTAGSKTGSGVDELYGVKNFPFSPLETERVTVTGDNQALAEFLFDPIELPNFTMELGAANLDFDALVQSCTVEDVADISIVALQPTDMTYRDIVLIVQSQAKTVDGTSHWEGLIVPLANIFPMGRNSYQERIEATYQYSVITNKATTYPWGDAIDEENLGTVKTPAFRFSSPYRRKLWRWTGNNTETEFTLPETVVAASASAVPVWQNGVQLEYGAGAGKYTVSGTTLTFGTAPSNGAKIVTFMSYQ